MNFIVENNRIYMEDESKKLLAEVTFENIDEQTVEIDHTFVDKSLSGKGIASELINMLALKLRSENKKAIPTCSYAVKWFEKHTEFKDILE